MVTWPRTPAVLAVLAACSALASGQDIPVVRIPQGELRPTLMTSAFDNHTIYAFLGIPYGRVAARFARAEPAGAWEGVRDATADGAECPQWDPAAGRALGSEDCLFVNVYTRKLPPANPTVPLVFLHGGDWLAGSGSSRWYGPRYWLDHDVLLVTVNYRLGAFGFLSTGDSEAPGNQGLWDQRLALQWIDDNIQFFGGLRSHTTIMGEGSGGASVHLLQLSPTAKNLFERAISQSGTALCPGALVPESVESTTELAERLACPTAPSSAMVACLRDVSEEEICRATAHMSSRLSSAAPFGPVVDGYATEPFLPLPPSQLMEANNFRHCPWVVGINRDEGADLAYSLLTSPERLEKLNNNFAEVAPQLLRLTRSTDDPSAVSEQIRKHYFGNQPIGDATAAQLVELLTDRMFLHCTEKAAHWHSFYSTHKVFVYQWNLQGRVRFRDLQQKTQQPGDDPDHWHPGNPRFARRGGSAHELGVSQKDELLLMFSNDFTPLFDRDDPLVTELRQILNMWVTFAKAGDPTPDLAGEGIALWREIWEHYLPLDEHYLVIDREWTTVHELRSKAIQFWDSLGLNENVFKHKIVRDEL
ncbi:Esterase FE4 [Amphibalanus amphitrite]|uniref:Esterase FE4 n=1 Tax=Amphibalanus amphitrite TaxID=1232801 RepID=A0A6A4WX71_AMPAM|nr:Esterase FE4 [Amphibalanus amphitrite]